MFITYVIYFFFFNDTATTEIYTLSLHDALPIYGAAPAPDVLAERASGNGVCARVQEVPGHQLLGIRPRHVALQRSLSLLHSLSGDDQEGIRADGQAPRFLGTRRRSQRARSEQAVAAAHRRTPRHPFHEVHAIDRAGASLAVNRLLAEPIHIAAMDAGSNALRFSIARALSPLDIEVLLSERCPVRLGENAFTEQRISHETLSLAAAAFRAFRGEMNALGGAADRAAG